MQPNVIRLSNRRAYLWPGLEPRFTGNNTFILTTLQSLSFDTMHFEFLLDLFNEPYLNN